MGQMRRHYGFSLIEVLLAVGTLAVGMIFIGGTYLVAVHLAGVSAERTTATVVANEAFSKIRLLVPNLGGLTNSQRRIWLSDPNEFAYPSERTVYPETGALPERQYWWSALSRRDPNDPSGRTSVVTVFISRKVGAAMLYPFPTAPPGYVQQWPVAMRVEVQGVPGSNVLTLVDDPATMNDDETRWIGAGFTIVEDSSGHIYRVIKPGAGPTEVVLDRPWDTRGVYPTPNDFVWTVPPPVGRGKGPCIEVYQTEIRF